MAAVVNIPGPCEVLVDTGSTNALESLGWTVNGAQIEQIDFEHEVKGDQNGGDEGSPIEIQYLGYIHRVTLDLSKYDEAVLSKIQPTLYGGTEGTRGYIGTAKSTNSYRLLLKPQFGGSVTSQAVRNYLVAMPKRPAHVIGTKSTQKRITFDCHPNSSGVVYNKTSS